MTDCVRLYEQVATASGEPLSHALSGLREETGMPIDHSLWSRWRSGRRTPPPHVVRAMLRMIVERALREAGIETGPLSDAQVEQLAAALTPPDRGDAS